MRYAKSKMDTYNAHGSWLDQPCVVFCEGAEITVEYEDEGHQQYRGLDKGEGHYELSSRSFADGRATLHRFEGGLILEGSYREQGNSGMWRIRLLEE
ncbi:MULTISPECIES: hypothetical protein [unclassified Pseudomonas]|jgi:hypothetical protein|uniref:hypothetical protein n=1 Tax=unclassified Pseudomonas TaxID=196821 RepID=UPI002003E88D|nr:MULTISPECIES: hypothetical protein [unclassified Pseudomonas]MCK6189914.1 hypothetical protein [Pseudomonas sp. EYE_354]WLH66840.1 hypothetical protein PSH59_17115 [Pseudomonas sp. FP2309]